MKSLCDAMLDPALFGRTFGGPTFGNWRTVAKVLDGMPLDAAELTFYREITGRCAVSGSVSQSSLAERAGRSLLALSACTLRCRTTVIASGRVRWRPWR